MKNACKIQWTIYDDNKLLNTLDFLPLKTQKKLKRLCKSNKFPTLDILKNFESKTLCRPLGSRRAFYLKNNYNESVIAIKGTEILSSKFKREMEYDKKTLIQTRPWTLLENFIYREQKAPLAVLLDEAKNEAMISANFQKASYQNFNFLEEAPLPLVIFKWNKIIVKNYIKIISKFLDSRAQELIIPIIQQSGLGGIIYYYPYLPTRVRFEKQNNITNSKKNFEKKLSKFNNLIDIQARMFLSGFLPFSFEDHGIGQCIAPQNVTLNGGICDLGSLKEIDSIDESKIYTLLRATGGLLTRTFFEFLGGNVKDTIYEFENPTTIMHHLSAVVHRKLGNSLKRQSLKYSMKINENIKTYYESDDSSLIKSLII